MSPCRAHASKMPRSAIATAPSGATTTLRPPCRRIVGGVVTVSVRAGPPRLGAKRLAVARCRSGSPRTPTSPQSGRNEAHERQRASRPVSSSWRRASARLDAGRPGSRPDGIVPPHRGRPPLAWIWGSGTVLDWDGGSHHGAATAAGSTTGNLSPKSHASAASSIAVNASARTAPARRKSWNGGRMVPRCYPRRYPPDSPKSKACP
jgi:hypothetical protein